MVLRRHINRIVNRFRKYLNNIDNKTNAIYLTRQVYELTFYTHFNCIYWKRVDPSKTKYITVDNIRASLDLRDTEVKNTNSIY